jgi:hypothetical protein
MGNSRVGVWDPVDALLFLHSIRNHLFPSYSTSHSLYGTRLPCAGVERHVKRPVSQGLDSITRQPGFLSRRRARSTPGGHVGGYLQSLCHRLLAGRRRANGPNG